MSGLIASYGRLGPNAGGDPKVAELLHRTVDGHYHALSAFEATLAGIQSRGLAPWSAPVFDLTLLNYQWLTLNAWERATAFLDACVTGNLDQVALRQLDILCDQAAQASVAVVGLQAEVSQGKQPGMKQPTQLSIPPLNPANVIATWAMIESIGMRLFADIAKMQKMGIPPSMHKVKDVLRAAYDPKAQVFNYLRKQWATVTTDENRMQVAREALPIAKSFFVLGQQLWTPYMLGSVYTDIVRSTMVFDRLGLGFEPWLLSDPAEASNRATDVVSCRELASFWETVSDKQSAKTIQDEIHLAVFANSVSIVPGKAFHMAPWLPQYLTNSSVTIGGVSFEPGDLFSVYPRGAAGQRTIEVRKIGHA